MLRAIAAGIVLFAVLPALVAVLVDALRADLGLLGSGAIWRLLLTSILRAAFVTVLALLLGVPLGALFARSRMPLRGLLFALHLLPACLPPLLLALGWFYLTGGWLFGEAGAVIILTFAFAPLVTGSTWLGIRSLHPSLEEAALIVAPPSLVMATILVPASWPAITMSALLVFVLAFGELTVPMFLRVDSYGAAVFSRLGGIDYAPGEAAVLVLPLIPLAWLLFAVERRFLAPRIGAVAGASHRPSLPMRTSVVLVAIVLALLPMVPIAGLLSRARFGDAIEWVGPTLMNSVATATIAAAVITATAVLLGHAIARGSRVGRFVDAISVLVFLLPPAVLGVGLISVWNRPALRPVYGSLAIIIIGFVARYAIAGIRTVAAAIVRSPASVEDAARIAGATPARTLFRVVIPMHARAIAGAFLISVLFCLRDVETAILYYPPGGEPLPVRIFTLEANGPEPVVAALAILQVGLTASLLGALWFARRRSR